VASALGGVIAGLIFICTAHVSSGLFVIASALVCAGLGIFTFYGCKYATKGIVVLTKNAVVGLKNRLLHKENAQ
jgi:hypothetical protein